MPRTSRRGAGDRDIECISMFRSEAADPAETVDICCTQYGYIAYAVWAGSARGVREKTGKTVSENRDRAVTRRVVALARI
jgi:hypothetical protein